MTIRLDDVPSIPVAHADVPDLAGSDEVVQHPHGLLNRGVKVPVVALVKIDVVGAQPAQTRLDLR